MGVDLRKSFELHLDTRDSELSDKVDQITEQFKKSLIEIRNSYSDKDYFDKCIFSTDLSYAYYGMYSGCEEDLIAGEWVKRLNLFPDSPYCEMVFRDPPFQEGDGEKVSDLRIYELEEGILASWRGNNKKFLELPENYKFLLEVEGGKDAEYFTDFYQKVLKFIDDELETKYEPINPEKSSDFEKTLEELLK